MTQGSAEVKDTATDKVTGAASSSWQRTLTAAGATIHNGRVRHFGDLSTDFSALEQAGLVPLLGVTVLQLTGADRLEFLHGQISNEVKRLAVGERRTALLLNVRGHALALLNVYRRDADLVVAVEGGAGAQVEAQLRAHIIFDQVELSNQSGILTTLTLQGTRAAEIVEQAFGSEPPNPGTFVQLPLASAKVLVSSAARTQAGGFDLQVLTQAAPALLTALQEAGAALAGEEALEAHRIAAGLPDAEHEGGAGVLPQEAGLEYAVSYHKGCYLGQEIMARIEARGKLRRRLVGLRLNALPKTDVRDLVHNGKTVGRLGGVAEHPQLGVIALASVRTELEAGTTLELDAQAARLSKLPLEP